MQTLKTFADWIAHHSRNRPRDQAWGVLRHNKVDWYDWQTIQAWIENTARWLNECNVQSGDRVLSVLPNCAAWICIDAACARIGAIHVPVDPRIKLESLEYVIQKTEPQLIVRSTEHRQATEAISVPHITVRAIEKEPQPNNAIAAVEQQVAPDFALFTISNQVGHDHKPNTTKDKSDRDIANILFTSGTTGNPKGVMLSHRNLVANAHAKLDAMPQFTSDVRLNLLPFSHAYARTCEVTTWAISGCSLVCSASLDQFWSDVLVVQPTLFNAVPIVFQKLFDAMSRNGGDDKTFLTSKLGPRIRMLACGGAALPASVFDRFQRVGFPIYQGYGLTETSPVICSNRTGNARSGTVGPPIRDIEIRIDDSGQLFVRGEHVMVGYWHDSEATTRRIQDGWLATGDLVAQDPDGHLRILGRHDDLIVLSTGRKVSPMMIEQALMSDPSFGQVMVVGQHRPYLIALAFPKFGDTGNELMTEAELLRKSAEPLSNFASFERPKRILAMNQRLDGLPQLLTHKGSLRRQSIEAYFSEAINRAYEMER